MTFLFRLWSSKNFWIFFICFVVIGSIVGGILGFLGSKGFFDKVDKKAIGEKYCYFYNKNNIVTPYSSVMITGDKAKDIIKFYNGMLKPYNDLPLSIDWEKTDGEVSTFTKVEVLGYIDDSSLVSCQVIIVG